MVDKHLLLISFIVTLMAGTSKAQGLESGFIDSSMGSIYYQKNEIAGSSPIIFLHGVYFDHRLWEKVSAQFTSNTIIAIDMPMHGKSKRGVPKSWNMDDISQLLIELLDSLEIDRCYAIGHSWGSMSILRASVKSPERFLAVGLANMPIDKASQKRRRTFTLQHSMLGFRKFYTNQAAKSLFSPQSLTSQPGLKKVLNASMVLLKNSEIRQTDKAVITQVDDGRTYIDKLSVPVLGLVGKDDYVNVSPQIPTRIVEGGHVSPLEAPEAFVQFVKDVLALR